jgi:hypothetical protein
MLPRTSPIAVGKSQFPVIVSPGDEKSDFSVFSLLYGRFVEVKEEPQKNTSSSTFVPYL